MSIFFFFGGGGGLGLEVGEVGYFVGDVFFCIAFLSVHCNEKTSMALTS